MKTGEIYKNREDFSLILESFPSVFPFLKISRILLENSLNEGRKDCQNKGDFSVLLKTISTSLLGFLL